MVSKKGVLQWIAQLKRCVKEEYLSEEQLVKVQNDVHDIMARIYQYQQEGITNVPKCNNCGVELGLQEMAEGKILCSACETREAEAEEKHFQDKKEG